MKKKRNNTNTVLYTEYNFTASTFHGYNKNEYTCSYHKSFFFLKTEMFFPVRIQKTNHKISQNISGL